MKLELDYTKSPDENAIHYFEQSKLAKRKIAGLKIALEEIKKKQAQKDKKEKERQDAEERVFERKRTKKWFEKYRWFVSSDGFLVIGGRDAHSNEEIVKKRMKKNDVYFHADVFGAPHCMIQTGGEDVPKKTMEEAAQFAATFSKAWQEGRASADSYSVAPENVSKKAPSGESMGTGAFMIYGEREWFKKTPLRCAIGYYEKEKILMAGPPSAIKSNTSFLVELKQGGKKKSDLAKELKSKFEKKGYSFSLDEFVSLTPNGESSII